MIKIAIYALTFAHVYSSELVRTLTSSDKFESILDMESVIIIQYEDRKTEDWVAFD